MDTNHFDMVCTCTSLSTIENTLKIHCKYCMHSAPVTVAAAYPQSTLTYCSLSSTVSYETCIVVLNSVAGWRNLDVDIPGYWYSRGGRLESGSSNQNLLSSSYPSGDTLYLTLLGYLCPLPPFPPPRILSGEVGTGTCGPEWGTFSAWMLHISL